MKKELKYNYRLVIQGFFAGCYGWEDCADYNAKSREETKQAHADIKEYRASGQGSYRLIRRRELNPLYVAVVS